MSADARRALERDTQWDPGQYLRFSDQRLRPALELLDRVPLVSPELVCDLGCGTGQVTRAIAQRWPSATVCGIDSSRQMLEKAAAEPGAVRWIEADIRRWQPDAPPELLYSNAALHWIEAHDALFPRLIGHLKAGGCLAVQMPLNWEAPSHRLMRETLTDGGPAGRALGSEELRLLAARKRVEDAARYYELLVDITKSLDIWETEYLQILGGEDPVLEWVKGTGLRPILRGLDDGERELFVAEYSRRLRAAYPTRADGSTLYPFRRLFLVATV